MQPTVEEQARIFDRDGTIKSEVNEALAKLKIFEAKYPFVENPELIDTLKPKDIFKSDSGKIGDFFHWIEYYLKPLGHLTVYSNVYRRIGSRLEIFKELLYVVVDKKKSLAEKVDATWKEIGGLGGDSHIAKKIIFCFNYETGLVVPIFSTAHLEFFLETILEGQIFPVNYGTMSLGEKYEFLSDKLLEAKESSRVTDSWEITYFCRFLYESYPPPKIITQAQRKKLHEQALSEQQRQFKDFMLLLNDLRRKGRISAEVLREYSQRWRNNPQDRKNMTEQLLALQTR
jgi:hypothetical protein